MKIELEEVFVLNRMKWTEENEIEKQNKDTQWNGDKRLATAPHNNNIVGIYDEKDSWNSSGV